MYQGPFCINNSKVRRGNSDQTSGLWNSRQFFSGLKALDLEPRPYTSSLSFAVSRCKLICVYSAYIC